LAYNLRDAVVKKSIVLLNQNLADISPFKKGKWWKSIAAPQL